MATCSVPAAETTDYILNNLGVANLTRADVQRALKLVPFAGGVSYGDAFEWVSVAQNATNCFSQNDTGKGIKIIGSYSSQFAASTALKQTITSLLGANVFLPADILNWGLVYIFNRIDNVAASNEFALYVAARESCEQRNVSPSYNCQSALIQASAQNDPSPNNGVVLFDDKGFILQAEIPVASNLLNLSAIPSVNNYNADTGMFLAENNIPISPQDFFKASGVIYDLMSAKQSGSLDALNSSLLQKFKEDAGKLPKELAPQQVSQPSVLQSLASGITNFFVGVGNKVAKVFGGNSSAPTSNSSSSPRVAIVSEASSANVLAQPPASALPQQPAAVAPKIQSKPESKVNKTTPPAVSPPQASTQLQTTAPPRACTPSWTCGEWSTCTNSKQARTCIDGNNCGVTASVPVTQPCASNPAVVSTPPPPPAPFSTLTSEYGGVGYGEGTTLRWSSSNATVCTASGGWNGSKPLSGSENTGPLYSTQTFNLTCTGSGGSVSQHVSISVSSPPTATPNPSSPTLTFSTKTGWVKSGAGTTLIWSSPNADTCTASGGWSGGKSLSGSEDTGPLNSTQTFVLTCTGAGGSATRSTSVGIADQPELAVADTYAATQGKTFNFSGKKFTANGSVTLHFSKPDGSFYPVQRSTADASGNLAYAWPVPADAVPGASAVSATDDTSGMQSNSLGFNIVAAAQVSGDVEISVLPPSGPAGTTFTVTGKNFTPNSSLILRFELPDTDQYSDRHYPPQQPAADANGNLTFNWQSPQDAPSFLLGTVSVWALDNRTGRRSNSVPVQITAAQ